MRKLFLSLLISLFAFTAMSQDTATVKLPTTSKGFVKYKDTIKITIGLDQKALYLKTLDWLKDFYPNSQAVTKTRNPKDGLIIGESLIQLTTETESGTTIRYARVKYRFRFQISDNQLIYTYKDFTVTANKKTTDLKDWLKTDGNSAYAGQIKEYMDSMLEGLETFLNTPEEEEDDF